MLSHREQVNQARRIAVRALTEYPLTDPTLRFVAHGENTTFQVRARTDGGAVERFLLRVHRPMRHGRFIDSTAAIASELRWSMALRAQADLLTPQPLPTREGELTTTTSAPGAPQPRTCSVLRWMDGRRHTRSPRPVHLHRLGAAMARLHNHADTWPHPAGFVRTRWDWETFFGDTMQYGGINAAQVWDLLPDDLRRAFDRVAAAARRAMTQLGEGPETFGLIHADLHLDNALFAGDVVKLIDFDDCGIGHRIYDVAVALWELRHRGDYPALRTALIDGYTAHRPLPQAHLDHLDMFIAIREVAFGLWFVGTAQTNPVFQDKLPRELGAIRRSLETLQSL
ncbi:phosphotransferase [Lentzea tibetensis]|uniref:Phosphotransferase n=1 Tax=Lentzea tibetensis TaxID=2591470 RepID=A0A563F1E3_9PSEU|nr:phosphotransferase [Lentzea tibetensis]TWP53780.1 phosphotransferase [Lentzea tibetensis]